MRSSIILIFLTLITFISAAVTNIPDDFVTIQEGIENTNIRSTVLVEPGLYQETPIQISISETLRSSDILDSEFPPIAGIDNPRSINLYDLEPHFNTVWSGIPLSPMVIYVNSAILDSENLQVGDEIGIFDNENCVGAVQINTETIYPIMITLSLDLTSSLDLIDGFTPGNPILIKYWDASNGVEIGLVDILFEEGNEVFTPLGYAYVSLESDSVFGCTDPNAINYNPEATIENNTCIYPILGCTNEDACNYNQDATADDGSCYFPDCAGVCDGTAFENECGCVGGGTGLDGNWCFGCLDPYAINFDPEVLFSDNSCVYPQMGDVDFDSTVTILDLVIIVDWIINDNPDYIAYADLNNDGYINIIDVVIFIEWLLYPYLVGCTDPIAENFNPEAYYDNGTCQYENIVTDIDGNVYETIQIGDQIWMAENLRVTHYRNGDPIATGHNPTEWGALSTGAYAIYDDDFEHSEIFANLYNWWALNDERGICPEEFHIPSHEEWGQLVNFLGGLDVAGGFLKSTGTIENEDGFWQSPNVYSSNEFGFSALPGGRRNYSPGYFYDIYSKAYFWSSTMSSYNGAFRWVLEHDNSSIYYEDVGTRHGLSIRCLKELD